MSALNQNAVLKNAQTLHDIPRVLILTSSTGSGHDMRAKAFREWVQHLYGDKVEVRIEHVLENSCWLGRLGVGTYNFIQRNAPIMHNVYWELVEVILKTHHQRVQMGGRYYRRLISEYRPHLILSVHDSLNRGYFEDARRILGADRVNCVTYCGEWSGGRGFSRNWVNPSADMFYARTTDSMAFAIQLGVDVSRTAVFRKLLPPHAFLDALREDEIRSFKQKELGFDSDRFTLLLATGLFGSNHHIRYLNLLLKHHREVQVIVVCGQNQKALQNVLKWQAKHPQLTLYPEGYTQRMHHLMQVSDAVVTRPGANTTAEALHLNCPIIYNTFGGTMPQERLTVQYFLKEQAAKVIRTNAEFTQVIEEWKDRGERYQAFRSRLLKLKTGESPEHFVKNLIGRAGQCARSDCRLQSVI